MLPFHLKRLVIAQHRFDYRKHWNGMLGECYRMGFDPYDGDCVVFVKSDRTQLRALAGDLRRAVARPLIGRPAKLRSRHERCRNSCRTLPGLH